MMNSNDNQPSTPQVRGTGDKQKNLTPNTDPYTAEDKDKRNRTAIKVAVTVVLLVFFSALLFNLLVPTPVEPVPAPTPPTPVEPAVTTNPLMEELLELRESKVLAEGAMYACHSADGVTLQDTTPTTEQFYSALKGASDVDGGGTFTTYVDPACLYLYDYPQGDNPDLTAVMEEMLELSASMNFPQPQTEYDGNHFVQPLMLRTGDDGTNYRGVNAVSYFVGQAGHEMSPVTNPNYIDPAQQKQVADLLYALATSPADSFREIVVDDVIAQQAVDVLEWTVSQSS